MAEPDLLVTKFTIPPLRASLLSREHLLTILDQSRTVPLTLLSASAGFGKTTLLSSWARQSPVKVAWLTLDEQDDDPTRFWTYVIAALRRSGSPVGEATLAMLQSPQSSRLSDALTSLINELAELAPETVLILDDYHLIKEQVIHDSLQFLLDHLPASLHLFLSSRADPGLSLARLRVRGQVVELRELDLRLSSQEANQFLTQIMDLTLTEEEASRLEKRTEGWIAGLQLAALSMRRYADASAFIESFTGSHRFILDYVQDEILEPLPDAQQRFLLQTSVLTRLNAGLCQALTGEAASQSMLKWLERSNLFLLSLDEERRWYRFHTLFREVLLARLQATQPEQLPQLHRKAAVWYQQQGSLHAAIPHALATRDFFFVAELLEGTVELLFTRGELQTLLGWLKLLPEAVLIAHPRLATSYILAFNMMFPFSYQAQAERVSLRQLRANLERSLQPDAPPALTEPEQERLRSRLTILDGWELMAQALAQGNVEQLDKLAGHIQHIPSDEAMVWQQHRLAPFAMAWRMAGNFPPMVAALQEGRKLTWQTQNRYQEIQVLWALIAALIALGELRQAHAYCQELRELVIQLGGPLPVAAYPDLFEAQLACEWNQLEIAKSAAQKAIQKTAPLQYLDILVNAYEVLFRVCLAQGALTEAEQAVHAAEGVVKSADIPLFLSWVESLWVRLWLAQGNLSKASKWAENSPYHQESPGYSHEAAYLALVRVYLAKHDYAPALKLLATLLDNAERVARTGTIISLLALQVTALYQSGAQQEALDALLRLLTLTEPEGHVRVLLEAGLSMQQALQLLYNSKQAASSPVVAAYAQTVLKAFAAEQPQAQENLTSPSKMLPRASSPAVQPLIEPLTSRELEVLPLLAEGASNQEIATQLVISLPTAKKHVASILSKLSAENRTQAIAYARSLSLL